MHYDDIVIGLGAMGSSTVYQLTKRGRKTLGIDEREVGQKHLPGERGARVTRTAIGDDGVHTPFARRSDELLDELERASSVRLRMKTGGLLVRKPDSEASELVSKPFEREAASARSYGVGYEWLEAKDIRRRFSPLRVRFGEIGYYEPESGYVKPGHCVSIQLGLAGLSGAEIRRGERALSFHACSDGVSVETNRGTYRAERLIVCVGAWASDLLGEAFAERSSLRHETVYCFEVADERPFLPKNFPVFTWGQQNSHKEIHGFPAVDGFEGGVKIATERNVKAGISVKSERVVSPEEAAAMHESCIAPRMRGVTSRILKAWTRTCAVPNNAGFTVDRHPESAAITVVSACTGFGSKYAPAVGEAIAQTLVDGRSALDLTAFRSDRSRDSMAIA
ncbi:MAG: N-methyl-L-tryptophan oxidase [Patescibacteria group bacterium]